jgi:hypothetical protein
MSPSLAMMMVVVGVAATLFIHQASAGEEDQQQCPKEDHEPIEDGQDGIYKIYKFANTEKIIINLKKSIYNVPILLIKLMINLF